MKVLLFISVLFISTLSFGQNVKDTTVNDSTLLISVNDLLPLYKELKKLPYEQAEPFIKYLERLVATKADEYKKKKKQ